MFSYDDLVRRFIPSVKRSQILYSERRDVNKMTDYMERHIEEEWVDGFLQADWCYEDNDEIRPTKE